MGDSVNMASLLVAEDVGVKVADAVGCQERGNESKRPNDQNGREVHVTRGHGKVTGPSGTWKPPPPKKMQGVIFHSSESTG